jgi:hypothetical protein
VRISELEPTPSVAEPLEIPAELLDSVHRHQANLASLMASMRSAGLDDDMVNASVRTLIDSYAAELGAAIRTMMAGPNDE